MRRFELEPFLADFEKFNINEVAMVPPIVRITNLILSMFLPSTLSSLTTLSL